MSELGKRVLSGLLLAALLLGDLWLGSWWYVGLLLVGGLIVLREFVRLAMRITSRPLSRSVWCACGAVYIMLAIAGLWQIRAPAFGFWFAAWLFAAVWATDVGAFVFGRSIGGPKIAPAISPSKTWAGLLGGAVCASLVMLIFGQITGWPAFGDRVADRVGFSVGLGTVVAIVSQSGDFFESWMKRRAGVKDSGTLIPGHGGLFDRVDGLLPVAIVFPYLLGVAR